MKLFKISLTILFVLTLVFSACSKKGADKIIGKWKADKIEAMEKMGVSTDVTYEFAKDTMFFEMSMKHKVQGLDTVITIPKVKVPYIIKSDDGTTIVLEATHPENKAKGEFTIKLNDKKMVLTDPDKKELNLTKM
jgi:hypothetical protein